MSDTDFQPDDDYADDDFGDDDSDDAAEVDGDDFNGGDVEGDDYADDDFGGDNDADDDYADDDYDSGDVNTIEVPTARNVLEYLVKSVVENPEEVEVEVVERQGSVTLEVTVAEGDMGRVIGRRGRVANSIRTVVRAAASKDGRSIDVEFVD